MMNVRTTRLRRLVAVPFLRILSMDTLFWFAGIFESDASVCLSCKILNRRNLNIAYRANLMIICAATKGSSEVD